MAKFYAILTIILALVFGAILFVTQGKSSKALISSDGFPTLPPDADTFRAIQPTQSQEQAQQQAQQQQQQAGKEVYGVEEDMKASYSATIKTSKGNITVTLFGKDAPNTVKNFINKSQSGFYKNLIFHRVEDWVIQGGDPLGNGTGGGQMLTEANQLPFVNGSLGVARGSDPRISNDAQFFITKGEASHLNSQYTNFGIVTSGMDIVSKIQIGDKILGITVEK
jgi:peptidyl-prolyl cis-trans isomerase B (cyclophilin B)